MAILLSGCEKSVSTGADRALRFFENKKDGSWLRVEGTVIKSLSDDIEIPRHQRFIIKTEKGQTILIVHNIDIAKRIPIEPGKHLLVSGEYLWNPQGGRIHYTHRSTSRKKPGGYIKDLDTDKIYD
ncbi:MAG: hypothetical protein A2161_04815 [Candidatus Schekmanbacteria bacterium RBG_13_48_7]|uniref:DUF3465 domain-containing protein n=1 Tax=Candidatus Schekmanbacteria bacterium RBG_13_48_7 TaxID=1817878 RepID=A0A1F7RPK1_9BACT|nr:MAG: hypothetical protein A2161_04815 [Candidatus Schekmanbacteria bacterium RBG_13_48_7]